MISWCCKRDDEDFLGVLPMPMFRLRSDLKRKGLRAGLFVSCFEVESGGVSRPVVLIDSLFIKPGKAGRGVMGGGVGASRLTRLKKDFVKTVGRPIRYNDTHEKCSILARTHPPLFLPPISPPSLFPRMPSGPMLVLLTGTFVPPLTISSSDRFFLGPG